MIDYNDLGIETRVEEKTIKVCGDKELTVRNYLPMAEKIALISYVVDHALDESTGRFSPVRVGLFFDLAVAHFYGGINFPDEVKALDAYDALETNFVLNAIISAIPQDEYVSMRELVIETTNDIADYNSSFAGVMQIASQDADGLGNQIEELLGKVKNREGMELLSEIKNVVGTD